MRFERYDAIDVGCYFTNSSGPFPGPKQARYRRTIDPHEKLLKLTTLGVNTFRAICLMRDRRVEEASVLIPTLLDGKQSSLARLEEASAVAADMAAVLAERIGMRLFDTLADCDVFVEVAATIDRKDGLPRLLGDVRALTDSEYAAVIGKFGRL